MDQRQRKITAFNIPRQQGNAGSFSIFKPAPNARDVGLNAYVPSGFSEKDWAAKQAMEKNKKSKTDKFWTKKRSQGYEDLTEWQ